MVLPPGGVNGPRLAAVELDEPVRIALAEIPGMQPTVDQRLASGLLVLVVALKHVGPTDQDLPVPGALHLTARERLANRPELEVLGGRDRRRSGRLGHAP